MNHKIKKNYSQNQNSEISIDLDDDKNTIFKFDCYHQEEWYVFDQNQCIYCSELAEAKDLKCGMPNWAHYTYILNSSDCY